MFSLRMCKCQPITPDNIRSTFLKKQNNVLTCNERCTLNLLKSFIKFLDMNLQKQNRVKTWALIDCMFWSMWKNVNSRQGTILYTKNEEQLFTERSAERGEDKGKAQREGQRLTWQLPLGGRTTPLLWLRAFRKLSNYSRKKQQQTEREKWHGRKQLKVTER